MSAFSSGRVKAKKTYHKTPINTNPQPQAQKYKRNLIDATAQCAGPQPQERSQTIKQPVSQRHDQHVAVWKLVFDQVCRDHLADAVGVDEADVEHEGDEVLVEDDGL